MDREFSLVCPFLANNSLPCVHDAIALTELLEGVGRLMLPFSLRTEQLRPSRKNGRF
jgi:hypothetical protein